MENQGEIVIYQPSEEITLEVRIENESVWLTQAQMAELFQTTKQNVSLHINNFFKENELKWESVVKESLTTAADGKKYRTNYYNLDVIISTGYRVKSIRGTLFRQWANQMLRLQLDINRHNQQYVPINVSTFSDSHDRFLIIDDKVYLIGASIKDLGKRWFAFTELNAVTANDLLSKL